MKWHTLWPVALPGLLGTRQPFVQRVLAEGSLLYDSPCRRWSASTWKGAVNSDSLEELQRNNFAHGAKIVVNLEFPLPLSGYNA